MTYFTGSIYRTASENKYFPYSLSVFNYPAAGSAFPTVTRSRPPSVSASLITPRSLPPSVSASLIIPRSWLRIPATLIMHPFQLLLRTR